MFWYRATIWLHKETVPAHKKAIEQNTTPKGRHEVSSTMWGSSSFPMVLEAHNYVSGKSPFLRQILQSAEERREKGALHSFTLQYESKHSLQFPNASEEADPAIWNGNLDKKFGLISQWNSLITFLFIVIKFRVSFWASSIFLPLLLLVSTQIS